MQEITFEPFPKIGRLSRDMIITEKLDGTNMQVIVTEDGRIGCASRNQLILSAAPNGDPIFVNGDNYGFAAWVLSNKTALLTLGPGRHFGEWWGMGIQRKYGLSERRFSLFNVRRWDDPEKRPACCHVVPTLYAGNFDTEVVGVVMAQLLAGGSVAAPGFKKPEGVVIYHTQSGALFKKTFDKDDAGKGKEPLPDTAA